MSETTDLVTLTIDIETALNNAKTFKISDDGTRLKASESRKQVKIWEKAVGTKFDPEVEALYRPYKAKTDERKEYLDTLKTLDGIFKKAIETYDREQDDMRRRALAAEEAKRLEALKANPVGTEPQAQALIVAAPTPERPRATGEYEVEVWSIEVVDFKALPDEYKVANQSLLDSQVKGLKSLTSIPGTKVSSRKDIRQRA